MYNLEPLNTDQEWAKDGAIEFKDVTISYPHGPDILRNMTMSVKDGERVSLSLNIFDSLSDF